MHVTEVLHELVDGIRTGLSEVNRREMHGAVSDLEDLWRELHPDTAPAEREREPEPEPVMDADQARAKDLSDLKAKVGEIDAIKDDVGKILQLLTSKA